MREPTPAEVSPRTGLPTPLDEVRTALSELLGAERRLRSRDLRSRDHHQPADLTHAQLRALHALERTQQVTAGELARAAGLNPASVTAMLDQLETSGVAERGRDSSDRRVCMVSLTEKGRAVLQEKAARWQALWAERMGDLPAEDLQAALRVLRRATRLLDDL